MTKEQRTYKIMWKEACDKIAVLKKQLDLQKESIEEMSESLMSSVEEKGKTCTQILHFAGGEKKTLKGIITSSISQSEMTKFDLKDGRRVYINTKNVNMFEVFSE